jgi:hypothetical protein
MVRALLVAFLCLCGSSAVDAQPALLRWQAVLVAGDHAQPVFDNAIDAMARWLGEHGVAPADIHRLSARPRGPGVEPASAGAILRRIAALPPRPRTGCLVFITSHGTRGQGIRLAYSGEFLRPQALAQSLAAGCGTVPTVVIVSGCYTGAYVGGAMKAPNRIVLSAARADRTSFGCQADRTYTVFDECLLGALPRSVNWRTVYQTTLACVGAEEKELHAQPSQPQASFGAAVGGLAVY